MNDNPPVQQFFVVSKGKYIALAQKEEFGEWGLVSGVFKDPPTAEQVEMMLKNDLFHEITVLKVRQIGVLRGGPVYECEVAELTRAKDFKMIRFWNKQALQNGIRMSDAAREALEKREVQDRLA